MFLVEIMCCLLQFFFQPKVIFSHVVFSTKITPFRKRMVVIIFLVQSGWKSFHTYIKGLREVRVYPTMHSARLLYIHYAQPWPITGLQHGPNASLPGLFVDCLIRLLPPFYATTVAGANWQDCLEPLPHGKHLNMSALNVSIILAKTSSPLPFEIASPLLNVFVSWINIIGWETCLKLVQSGASVYMCLWRQTLWGLTLHQASQNKFLHGRKDLLIGAFKEGQPAIKLKSRIKITLATNCYTCLAG